MPVLRPAILASCLVLLLLCGCAGRTVTSGWSGSVLRTQDGEIISFASLMDELREADVIYVGENHDNPDHHAMQLRVLQELRRAGVDFVLGMEMFQVEDQEKLDRWRAGELSDEELQKVFWESWRMPWDMYAGIFHFARQQRLRLVGINIPREVVKKVARSGFASLSPADRQAIPADVTCTIDPSYKAFVKRIYTTHTGNGFNFDFFCEAQMLWTRSMARHLTDYLHNNPGSRMVVLTGAGHALKQGIPAYTQGLLPHQAAVIIPEVIELTRDNATAADTDYLMLSTVP
jgi:uncharacterized iron-regulated protein